MIPEHDLHEEHEALLEFVYLCPVGIAQLGANGSVEMMNPVGARVLMEIAARPDIENLFESLGTAGLELRALAQGMTADQGTICEAHRISFELPRRATPLTVSFTLIKVSPARLMAVIAAAMMVLIAWESAVVAFDQWDETMASMNASAAWFIVAVGVGCGHSALHLAWIALTGKPTMTEKVATE